MRRAVVPLLLVVLACPALAAAQGGPATSSAMPFKLGTFEIEGELRLGMVLEDKVIVELLAANRALERDPASPPVPMPTDMRALIGQYEYGLKHRLYEIVNDLV